MRFRRKLDAYERLTRLDKPIGILLLLWPTLWALWLAGEGRLPQPEILWIFILGTVLMRSAGCVINDWADRSFDGHVARTQQRPLVTGEVSPNEALGLAGVLALCAFLLILPLKPLVWYLSGAALLIAAIYPFTKRFLAVPQAWLGIAFGFGIPMAFAAVTGFIAVQAWVMLLGNLLWTIAYDTEYAMVDRADDLKIGIRTSAITFGRFDVVTVMLCYAGFIAVMVGIGLLAHCGGLYFIGLACAALIAVYHWILIRKREPVGCFRAFLHNNWLGAVIFCGIAADHAMRYGADYASQFHRWLS